MAENSLSGRWSPKPPGCQISCLLCLSHIQTHTLGAWTWWTGESWDFFFYIFLIIVAGGPETATHAGRKTHPRPQVSCRSTTDSTQTYIPESFLIYLIWREIIVLLSWLCHRVSAPLPPPPLKFAWQPVGGHCGGLRARRHCWFLMLWRSPFI